MFNKGFFWMISDNGGGHWVHADRQSFLKVSQERWNKGHLKRKCSTVSASILQSQSGTCMALILYKKNCWVCCGQLESAQEYDAVWCFLTVLPILGWVESAWWYGCLPFRHISYPIVGWCVFPVLNGPLFDHLLWDWYQKLVAVTSDPATSHPARKRGGASAVSFSCQPPRRTDLSLYSLLISTLLNSTLSTCSLYSLLHLDSPPLSTFSFVSTLHLCLYYPSAFHLDSPHVLSSSVYRLTRNIENADCWSATLFCSTTTSCW